MTTICLQIVVIWDNVFFDNLRYVILSANCLLKLLFALLNASEGSGQNLRQTEGREFLWTKGRGETGDPHQDGGGGGGKGHWQGRQDCKHTEALDFRKSPTPL